MDMSSMDMGASSTSSAAMSMNTATTSDMGGMDMGSTMDMGGCSVSMLGNWQTVGACFLTSSWHISTEAQFAGTCVGVFLIVVMIESVRRWGREWDRYILQQAALKRSAARQAALAAAARSASPSDKLAMEGSEQSHEPVGAGAAGAATNNNNNRNLARFERAFFGAPVGSAGAKVLASHGARFRPTVLQQLVRSLVYAVQFAGAYIVMLIAMSFNGYILISIVLGGLVGHFFSTWDSLTLSSPSDDDDDDLLTDGRTPTGGATRNVMAAKQETNFNVGGVCETGVCCG